MLCLQWCGFVPFIPPATRGHSFCCTSGDVGLFFLLCLWRLEVVPFIPLVSRRRSFCYASGGGGVWFDRSWLVTVRVVLIQSMLARHSHCGFVPVVAGLS